MFLLLLTLSYQLPDTARDGLMSKAKVYFTALKKCYKVSDVDIFPVVVADSSPGEHR